MSDDKEIRFIDSSYKALFYLPDGANIVLKYDDGTKQTLPCERIGDYHVKVGNGVYHICEFAEHMERAEIPYGPEIPQPLPDRCYAVHPTSGDLIRIIRDQKGFEVCPWSSPHRELNEKEALTFNERHHVTPQQEAAMLGGALHGWASPKARTSSYDLRGNPIKPQRSKAREKAPKSEPPSL